MMDNIPVHEKVMQGVYGSYAEALQEIRAKDMTFKRILQIVMVLT